MLKQLDSSVTQDENGELGGPKRKGEKESLDHSHCPILSVYQENHV